MAESCAHSLAEKPSQREFYRSPGPIIPVFAGNPKRAIQVLRMFPSAGHVINICAIPCPMDPVNRAILAQSGFFEIRRYACPSNTCRTPFGPGILSGPNLFRVTLLPFKPPQSRDQAIELFLVVRI